ncbi:MAG: DUF3572 domain-containing protein [Pseudomonadota bacterium]|nr:DUF3572 domain-containing protein [Pseudomonadota bacterium]
MLRNTTNDPPPDAEALALQALAATLTDERRAQRFLDLTGLDAVELRARAGERGLLAAALAFLEAHEPDLIAVAQVIGTTPEKLILARTELER